MNNFDFRTLPRLTLADLRYMCVQCESCKKCPFYKKYNSYVCKIVSLYTRIGINILCQDLDKIKDD